MNKLIINYCKTMEEHIFSFSFTDEGATEKVYKFHARTYKQASLEALIPLNNGKEATENRALNGSSYLR